MTKAVIYARVSTEEQHTENQIPVLENWAKQRGWEVIGISSEEESAWKAGHQRELAQLLKDARYGDFQLVLIWSLDRICRGGPSEIFPLIKSFNNYGVKVFSNQEPWTEQPEGPMYELLISVYSWVAKMESQRRSERTKLGMARARAQGKNIGRPKGSKDTKKRSRIAYLLREASYKQRKNFEEKYSDLVGVGTSNKGGK